MRSLVKYYGKKGYGLKKIENELKKRKVLISAAINIEELLILEAGAKKQYYKSFDIILEKYPYHFEKRMIRPPGNEMNSLLNYGYHLLYASFLSDIDKSPLIASISFIQSISKTTESLQFVLADILNLLLLIEWFSEW